MNKQKNIVLALSLPLSALMIFAGCVGMFTPGFYSKESSNWALQSVVQDTVDVFMVTPVLIISSIALLKNRNCFLLWGGTNLYLVYTYTIYCFDIHFSQLFLIYCISLGLAFYSFLYFLFVLYKHIIPTTIKRSVLKITGIYFLCIAVLFYCLWLLEIIPAVFYNTMPKNITANALATNPVHVLDLSIILPAIFLSGFYILKGKRFAIALAPAILVFFILMDISIAALSFAMNGYAYEMSSLVLIMTLLAIGSAVLLVLYFKNQTKPFNVSVYNDPGE